MLFAIRKKLTLPLILIVFVGVLSGCESKEEASETFYRQGVAYLESADTEKARLEFLNAIQRNPQNARAYYQLGLLARDQEELGLAFENIAIAVQLEDNFFQAQMRLIELYLYAQRFDEAEKILGQIQASPELKLTDQETHQFLSLKAAAELGFKRFEAAQLSVAQALEINPNDPEMYGLLAVIAQQRNQPHEVLKHLNRAIELSGDKTQYLTLRAGLHRQLKDLESLEKDYRILMNENPGEDQYVFLLARLLLDRKQFQDAETLVKQTILDHPGNQRAKRFLIEMLLSIDEARGLSLLDETIAQEVDNVKFRLYRVDLLAKRADQNPQNLIAAKDELNAMLVEDKYDRKTKREIQAALAEILLREGRRNEAMDLVMENLDADNQHEYSHLLKAEDDLAQRKYDDAIASLRTVLRFNPDSEKGLVLLGRVYDASGSDLLADDAFRQALALNPRSVEAAMPVASKLVAAQDLERSDAIITRVLASRPNDLKLLLFHAQVKILKKDWAGATSSIARLKGFSRGDAYAEFMSGQVAQGRGDCALAIESYRRALSLNPKLVPAMRELSLCFLTLGKADALLSFLEDYRSENPAATHAYLVAAQLYRVRNDIARAIEVLQQGVSSNPQWIDGYALLAGYNDENTDRDAAIATFKRGIQANPANKTLPVLLAGFYHAQGMLKEATLAYEKILRQEPENAMVINNYASLLLTTDDTEAHIKALALSEPLKNLRQVQFLDTYGWALYKNKRYAEAETYLRKAAESANRIAEIQYHFARSLVALERSEEARVVLKRAAKLEASEELQGLIRKDLEKLSI